MTKLLAISSSPRIGGNTDLLLDELLRGLRQSLQDAKREKSFLAEKIYLAQMHILPCAHCGHCRKTGHCKIQDDMQKLYPKLLEADWLVLASPIYFMAHCAQAKLFIDRCQALWARRNILKQSLVDSQESPRRGIFIAVGATHGPKVFAGAKITMKWFFEAVQMKYWQNLLFDGLDAKGAVRKHPIAMREAYEMGQRIAAYTIWEKPKDLSEK